jgi:predicted nucleic acid-binding protein
MTAIRWKFVLGLAVMLAAATAAADTVITAKEVISCSVESADADAVRLKLTRPRRRALSRREAYELGWRRRRILSTIDVCEIRLSDSSRVAELAAQLPRVKVTLDSGQYVPPSAVRAREMLRLEQDLAREARARGLPWIDTLVLSSSPGEMASRCRYMTAMLRAGGRSDKTVAGLLREVRREEAALRRTWPQAAARSLIYGTGCGLLGMGMTLGTLYYLAIQGEGHAEPSDAGCIVGGSAAGGALGLITGVALAVKSQKRLLARRRGHVNDLVRKVNRVFASPP